MGRRIVNACKKTSGVSWERTFIKTLSDAAQNQEKVQAVPKVPKDVVVQTGEKQPIQAEGTAHSGEEQSLSIGAAVPSIADEPSSKDGSLARLQVQTKPQAASIQASQAQTQQADQAVASIEEQSVPGDELPRPMEPNLVPDDYKMKVIKYIPTEIVAAYITLEGIIKASTPSPAGAYWMIFVILLILTPFYVWRITDQAGQKPAWDQIIVSFFSFIIWVMAIGGPFATLSWYQPIYPALLLPIFTLIVPLIKR